MAQQSYKARVMLGPLNLTCEARSATFSYSADSLDVTTLCDTSKVFIAGMDESSFTADGPLDVDGSANSPFDVFASFKSDGLTLTTYPITYAPSGLDPLSEAWLMDAFEEAFESTNSATGTADWSLTARSSGTDPGWIVEGEDTVTVDENGTARDFTAQSTNGAVFNLHVTAFSGLTSDDITIEDSADGSTGWSTVATFAQVTGLTSEQVEVTGTVERYLRVVHDVDGTGSITVTVAAARR